MLEASPFSGIEVKNFDLGKAILTSWEPRKGELMFSLYFVNTVYEIRRSLNRPPPAVDLKKESSLT